MRAPTFPKYLPSTVNALPNQPAIAQSLRTNSHAIRPGGMREAIESAAPLRFISREQGVLNGKGKSSKMKLNPPLNPSQRPCAFRWAAQKGA